MKTLNYINYNHLTDSTFNPIKTDKEQDEKFFYKGHPAFLIPDFYNGKADIWVTFLDWIEKQIGYEIWDQEGGEITSHKIISSDGYTKCRYEVYDVMLNEESEPKNIIVDIEGWVVDDLDGTYFLASKVIIHDYIN